MRTLPMVVASIVTAVLLSGCATTTSGTATPTRGGNGTKTGEQSSDPDEPPTAGAPKVGDPLDTARFQQNPCSALSTAQSQELDLGNAGSPVDMPLGNACEWRNTSTRGSTQIGFLDKDPRGLSSEYEANEKGLLEVFIELDPIEGYPAVVRGTIDRRHSGACTVVVGVSDEIAFETVLQLSRVNIGKKEPCEVSATIAGMALQTMKAG